MVDQDHDGVVRIVHKERLESPHKIHGPKQISQCKNTIKNTSMENNHKLKGKLQKVPLY